MGGGGGISFPPNPPGVTLSNDAKFSPAVKVQGWEHTLCVCEGGGGNQDQPHYYIRAKKEL